MATPNFIHIDKTIDADGIITVDFANDGIEVGDKVLNAAILVSRNGGDPTIPLRGIRLLTDGSPLEFSTAYQSWMFTVRTADGDAIEVVHMDGGTDAAEQIFVAVVEGNMWLTANHTINLWCLGGPTRSNLYTPTTALNTIYTTTVGTTAVTSGVGSVFWSYTLSETEVIAGNVRIVGRAIDAGTTYRSHALAEFSASRSTGGSAAITIDSETETGTLSGGAIATSVSGNDVLITLTYTFTGDVDWTITADLGRVLP
jgi:hypothetical protein